MDHRCSGARQALQVACMANHALKILQMLVTSGTCACIYAVWVAQEGVAFALQLLEIQVGPTLRKGVHTWDCDATAMPRLKYQFWWRRGHSAALGLASSARASTCCNP